MVGRIDGDPVDLPVTRCRTVDMDLGPAEPREFGSRICDEHATQIEPRFVAQRIEIDAIEGRCLPMSGERTAVDGDELVDLPTVDHPDPLAGELLAHQGKLDDHVEELANADETAHGQGGIQ